MIARRTFQEVEYLKQSLQRCSAIDPFAFNRDDKSHDAEAGAADRDEIIGRVASGLLPIAGRAADRMGTLPKVSDRLPLDDVQQRIVVKIGGVRW